MTRPIGTGPAGGAAAGASDVIAAMVAFADKRVISNQVPLAATGVYASYLLLDTALVGGPIAAAGPLVGGSYTFTVQALASGTSAGAEVDIQIVVDGVIVLPGPDQDFGVANGRFGFFGSFDNTGFLAAPGNHTVDIQFRQPGGPGVASLIGGQITIERDA